MITSNKFLTTQEYRIYPNVKQRELINQTLGCCRFVYNWNLANAQAVYEAWKLNPGLEKPKASHNEFSKALVPLKAEFEWLKNVSAVALQQSIRNLDTAYQRFFKGIADYPKFKRRSYGSSYKLVDTAFELFDLDESPKIKLARIPGHFNLNVNPRVLPKDIKSVIVKRTATDEYYISLVGLITRSKTNGLKITGVDVGIKDLFAKSDGIKTANPKHYISSQRRLRRAQQALSRKTKGSNNRHKARLKVARLHQRIRNQRKDLINRFTTQLVNENQVIAVENLNIKGMVKNRNLAKHINTAGWGEFVRQLEYKSKWSQHCSIVVVNRFYPSSKLCSVCDTKNNDLRLQHRTWVCGKCKTEHDRDINAAVNLRRVALTTMSCMDLKPGTVVMATTV